MEEAKKSRTNSKRKFTVAVKGLESLAKSSPTINQIEQGLQQMDIMYHIGLFKMFSRWILHSFTTQIQSE